jgi:hypothetical protein
MNKADPFSPAQNVDPFKKPTRNRTLLVLLLASISGLCLLVVFIGVVKSSRTGGFQAFRFHQASIDAMLEACTQDFYTEPQPWMALSPGSFDVLVLDHAQSSPLPDATYAYTFYLQVDPGRLLSGETLNIPGDGVSVMLLETRAPHIYCTSQLSGSLHIQNVQADGSLVTRLSVTRTLSGTQWEYDGEVEFTNPSSP